ncbi:MAG: Txe/YoeB family addiction module toxin [Candidatus Desulfovibrio faecigallinarum]|nr:Txe/YoeB family addiction module toxin [Candidatus Desulfovibrio faecigallinarum]
MKITFAGQAWEEYLSWGEDTKNPKSIHFLLRDLTRGGNEGTGKPEPLKGNLPGFWSRRIAAKNCLVYKITDEAAEIIQCRGHY